MRALSAVSGAAPTTEQIRRFLVAQRVTAGELEELLKPAAAAALEAEALHSVPAADKPDQHSSSSVLAEALPGADGDPFATSEDDTYRAPVRHADAIVKRFVEDCLDDLNRTGQLLQDTVTVLAGRRGLTASQLAAVFGLLDAYDIDLERSAPPAPYDGAGDLDGGIERRQVGHADSDGIRTYLRQISRVPLLTAAEEVYLGAAIAAGRAAQELLDSVMAPSDIQEKELLQTVLAGRRAHDSLVSANLRLVVSIARQPQFGHRGLDLLDCIQEGTLGVIRAADKFDYTLGYKFSTYATWLIRQTIGRGIADKGRSIRLPVHLEERVQKLRGAQGRLLRGLGRDPTLAELADDMGEGQGTIAALRDYLKDDVSLDAPVGDGNSTLGDLLAGGADADLVSDPLAPILQADRATAIEVVLDLLSPTERAIVKGRYGLGRPESATLDVLGKEQGVTRERIRQIQKAALDKLRRDPIVFDQLVDYVVDIAYADCPVPRGFTHDVPKRPRRVAVPAPKAGAS